nr:MAG TPA: hypothetical protein [Caudoviricetes sp.]
MASAAQDAPQADKPTMIKLRAQKRMAFPFKSLQS